MLDLLDYEEGNGSNSCDVRNWWSDRNGFLEFSTAERLARLESGGTSGLTQGPTGGQGVSGHAFALNADGQRIADEIERVYPDPVLLLGGSGLGKSMLAKHLADKVGGGFVSINAHEGMRLEPIVGTWRPQPLDQGVTVEWEDGALTSAVRDGGVFLFEEISRAPQELLSRLFGLLDSDNRSWSLIERGGDAVTVNADYWFIATGNPVGKGYATRKLDTALLNRFAAIYEINEPLAPESDILTAYAPARVVAGLIKFATDCRNNQDSYVSTRDLVQAARLIQRGFDAERAVAVAIAPKYGDLEAGVNAIAGQHLANLAPATVQPDIQPTTATTAKTAKTARTATARGQRKTKLQLGCVVKWSTRLLRIITDLHARGLEGTDAQTSVEFAQFTDGLKAASITWVCSCQPCVALRGHGLRVHPSGTVSKITAGGRTVGRSRGLAARLAGVLSLGSN
jgi:hypothetical protein